MINATMPLLMAISHEDVLSRIPQSSLRIPHNTGCGCNNILILLNLTVNVKMNIVYLCYTLISEALLVTYVICYLQTLNVNFSIIGISENWGTVENIDVQTMPGYSHEYCYVQTEKEVVV